MIECILVVWIKYQCESFFTRTLSADTNNSEHLQLNKQSSLYQSLLILQHYSFEMHRHCLHLEFKPRWMWLPTCVGSVRLLSCGRHIPAWEDYRRQLIITSSSSLTLNFFIVHDIINYPYCGWSFTTICSFLLIRRSYLAGNKIK